MYSFYERYEVNWIYILIGLLDFLIVPSLLYFTLDRDTFYAFLPWTLLFLLILFFWEAGLLGYGWIGMNRTELSSRRGLLPFRRSARYEDIVRVEYIRPPTQMQGILKDLLIVSMKSGDRLEIRSRHAGDVLSRLRSVRPDIEIVESRVQRVA